MDGRACWRRVSLKKMALCMVQIRRLAQRDVATIPVPPRPASADANGWPNSWINVYESVSAPSIVASNASNT
jgi:hypothetical protein